MKEIKGEFTYPSTRSMKGRSYPNLLFSEFLNESRLHDITGDYVDQHIKELYAGEHGDELPHYIENYDNIYDINFYDLTDSEEKEEFREWLYNEVCDRYKEAMDEMWSIEENGKVILYRVMTTTEKWINQLLAGKIKKLGEFWTWYKDAAEAHWGHKNSKQTQSVNLVIEIDEKHIDWTDSLNRNIGNLSEEREITIDTKKSSLKLLKVFVRDERGGTEYELDISNLKKRVYKP